MASFAHWLAGARPRTLPLAVAPVLAGSGAAAHEHGFAAVPAALALVVALAMQVGVNYANDYSDGIRGTDADRVGPLRLVGSGLAPPRQVRAAALGSLGVGALAGLALAATSGWELLLVGAAALPAAWFYTGGARPYGYRGLGELSVFVFFGLAAVLATTYAQLARLTWPSLAAAVGIGALACAVLVANNLRDIPTDAASGKRTLAVVLGDRRTRTAYLALLLVALGCLGWLAVLEPWAALGAAGLAAAIPAYRAVAQGAGGVGLVPVLKQTVLAELGYAVGVTVGLVVGR